MTLLKIRLLGPFQVWRDDELIASEEWPTQKTKDLLKILLTERGHVVSKDRLIELLWPDLAIRSGANSLRVGISHLRRTLEPGLARAADSTFILTRAQGYVFQVTSSCWIDVAVFQDAVSKGQASERRAEWGPAIAAYQAAEHLYRGDYLEGNPYDDWAIGPRELLRGVHLGLLSRLAECHAQQGHYRRALAACQRVLTLDPMRESVYRQVMVYHYRLGQRDQALRAFERCREMLASELDVDPMSETLALQKHILHEEAIEQPALVHPIPVPAKLGRHRVLAWLPFFGRGDETSTLVAHLQAAMAGQGRLVLITGEVGVGKTRLAQEFLALAEEHGAWVFQGRAYEPERDLSYHPVREALRRYLIHRLEPDEVRRILGSWAPYIASLIPELRQTLPDLPTLDTLPAEEERERLVSGLTQFCLSLAARNPVVFFLDDLQWADPSTLCFLHFLVRHIASEKVLVLGAYRVEEVTPNHPLSAVERRLVRKRLAVRVTPQRLSCAAVAQIVAHKAAPGWESGAFSQRLYRETEGNPLFLTELLRSLSDADLLQEDDLARWRPAPGVDLASEVLPLPETIQDVIESRFQAADSMSQRVLRTAAIIGRSFTFNLLQRASDLDTEVLLDALDDLVARQLIHEHLEVELTGYNFSHDKIREAIDKGLSPARRIHLHRKVTAALEAQYRGRTEEIAGRLAHHHLEAGEEERAVSYLLQAGDKARGLYAHQEAVDHYQRALAFLKEQGKYERAARTLMKLGLTYHIAFDFQLARQAFEEGFALWQRAAAMERSIRPAAPHALRLASTDPTTLDPTVATDTDSIEIIDQLFSGLVGRTPDMGIVPEVARTWEVLERGKKYVFYLRDDAHWSDGMPVTASDFEYAWKRVLDPANGSPIASILFDVKGARAFHQGEVGSGEVRVQARDPFTLVVELEEPTGYFPLLLASGYAYPVPQHKIETHGEAWANADHIVTNGPFKLTGWQRGHCMVLERNPTYSNRFTGNIQQVEVALLPKTTARLDMYKADELDALFLWGSPLEMNQARQRHAGEYVSGPALWTSYVGFDVSRPPFNERRVRQAFVLATDRETYADEFIRGYGFPATGGFVPPGVPGHSEGIGLPYDPERAKQLLAAAGYPGGRGFPVVELATSSAAPGREFLQAGWQDNLGIQINWETLDWAGLIDRLGREPPHISLIGFETGYPDPDSFLRIAARWPHTGWQNETYDALVAQAKRITDQPERIKLYRQADSILMQEAPIMPILYGRWHLLVKPWVNKFPTSAIKRWFWKDVVIEPH